MRVQWPEQAPECLVLFARKVLVAKHEDHPFEQGRSNRRGLSVCEARKIDGEDFATEIRCDGFEVDRVSSLYSNVPVMSDARAKQRYDPRGR